jgi:Bacterial Ig-like domain (group 3)
MKYATPKAFNPACLGLCFVLACALSTSGSAQVLPPPQPAITLDPATGWELQAHLFDSNGKALPEAPSNFRRLGEARVGELADLHSLTFRFSETITLTGIKSTPDFRIEKGGSCEAGDTFQKGATCTLLVRFTPQGPGNRLGRLSISTSGSATPMSFGIGGLGYSPVISFIPSIITTVPGTYPSSVGLLSGSWNMTVDGADRLYIADAGNNLIRSMDSSGTFKTIVSGYVDPQSVAVDTYGQIYFNVPLVSGLGSGEIYQAYDYNPAVNVVSGGIYPWDLSMDPNNRLFNEDSESSSHGAAFFQTQPYSPGTLLYDPFSYVTFPPAAFAVDSNDNLYTVYVAGGDCQIMQQSFYNAENLIKQFNRIVGGQTCGFSGDGGMAGNAEMGTIVGQITFDAAGNLYFSDSNNQRVRRVDYSTGIIRTIAGTGTAGYTGDNASATQAELNAPTGVGVNSSGAVYIISYSAASGNAQVVRKVGPGGYVNFGNQARAVASAAKQLIVSNTGNTAMTLTKEAITGANAADFTVDANSTTCILTVGTVLNAGQSCKIGIIFKPAATGARTATLTLLDNTISGTDTATLKGTGILPTPTLTVTSPAGGASFKSVTPITFSVTVTSTLTPAPTGTVQFKVDGVAHGGPVTISSGAASTSVSGLTIAGHSLSATYSGDANYAAAGPATVSIIITAVKIGSFVTLSQTVNAAGTCAAPQFAATVSGKSGLVATGQVQLLDAGTVLASGTLANGKAMLTPQRLSVGSHRITASYRGDNNYLPSVSPALVETVSPVRPCTDPVTGGGLHVSP